jgi:hypothetical protein
MGMRDLRTITVEDASAVPATLCWTAFVASLFPAALAAGCLPADPPGFRRDAGVEAEKPAKKAPKGPPPEVTRGAVLSADSLKEPFEDDFERTTLGPAWRATSSAWRIQNGRLCGANARNHPVWLQRKLPTNARLEFDAASSSADGDIKVEAWGDGKSAADAASYDNATSYIAIFGGWKNTRHVLARLDEHGQDRKELTVIPDSDDPRTQPVVQGRTYRLVIERDDGKTVRFSVDGHTLHELEDPAPLLGASHQFFGFNDWAVQVCFDNVRITPLGDEAAEQGGGGTPGSPP